MALESIAFLTYWLARLPAGPITTADTLLLEQEGEGIRRVSIEDFIEELLVEVGAGTPVTLVEETTLAATHGTVFVNPAEDAEIYLHMPVYAGVSARKRYTVKNIGQGLVKLDTLDAKTIDAQDVIDLAPGDWAEISKDGTNWQSFKP